MTKVCQEEKFGVLDLGPTIVSDQRRKIATAAFRRWGFCFASQGQRERARIFSEDVVASEFAFWEKGVFKLSRLRRLTRRLRRLPRRARHNRHPHHSHSETLKKMQLWRLWEELSWSLF